MLLRVNSTTGRLDLIGMEVGDSIKGGSANCVLYLNGLGQLAVDSNFIYEDGSTKLTVPMADINFIYSTDLHADVGDGTLTIAHDDPGGSISINSGISGGSIYIAASNELGIACDHAYITASYLRCSGNLGCLLTSAPTYEFQVGAYTADLAAPATASGSITKYGTGSNYSNDGYTHKVRVYAYKTVGGIKYISSTYKETSAVVDDGASDNVYVVNWTWAAVTGASGYILIKEDDWYPVVFNNSYGFDVGNVTSYEDDNAYAYVQLAPRLPSVPFAVDTSYVYSNEKSVVFKQRGATATLSLYGNGTGGAATYHPLMIYDASGDYLNCFFGNSYANAYPHYAIYGMVGRSGLHPYMGDFVANDIDNPFGAGDERMGVLQFYGGPAAYSAVFGVRNNTDTGFVIPVAMQSAGGVCLGNGSSASTAPATGFYAIGDSGIGVASPSARLHIIKTTEQLRIGYNTSNYLSITVSLAGNITYDAVGASAGHTFNDAMLLVSTITKYNNISTVSNGVPSEYATVDLTAQSAAISATTLYTPAASQTFRISIILQVTRAATTSSVLGGATGVVITYTEPDGSVAQSIVPLLTSQAGAVIVPATGNVGNTTTTQSQGSAVIRAKTAVAIQYAIGYTSVGATTMQYAVHLKLEAM